MDPRDLVSSLFWVAVAVFVLVHAIALGTGTLSSPGPGFLMFIASLSLGLLSLLLMATKVFKRAGSAGFSKMWQGRNWLKVALSVTALLLYAFFLTHLGFLLTSFALMVVLFGLDRQRAWMTLAYAAVTVVSCYVFFHILLAVPFPKGVLEF
jgi:signal transduction histidine kinase